MKRRILKTFTAILLMIVAVAGFMPCISREVKAEETTKQIVFDQSTIDSIDLERNESFSKNGITLNCKYEEYTLEDGTNSTVSFIHGDILVCHSSFIFSSSIGKISKIEIKCDSAFNYPSDDGWNYNDDDDILTWQGSVSDSVTIDNKAERQLYAVLISDISKMTFTIIAEDVSGITLNKSSLELNTKDKITETLTATVSPETAAYKEVTWSSSNTSVAKVSDSGLVTAVAAGEAVITATATNGTETTTDDKSATCKVTVKNPEPEVTKYPLYVGKNQVTSEYLKNDDEGWEYDPASNTLYLDNAKITDTNTYIVTRDCISYKGSPSDVLTISLSGNSTVGDENAQYAIETYASSLIITGNGSLTINAEYEVIDSGISLTIKDVSITANTGNIFSMRGMVINNSTVTVSNGTLWNSEKSIKITDSRVEVTDEPYGVGIGSDYSNISISGDSYVKADVTGSESKEEKFVMLFVDSLELKDGVEIVEPEEAEISNYKLPGTTSNTYSIFEKGSSTPAQKVIIARTYTIKFVNDDGTELQSSKVITGEVPKYEGDTPTKPSDGKYEYTFKGWDKEITEAKADATYTAVFESKEITTPQPDPKPVTPFPVPNTGVEGPSRSFDLLPVTFLGICLIGIIATGRKK